MTALDNGSTVDARGECHQSSLRTNSDSQGLNRIFRDVLGIVLRTYAADTLDNLQSHEFTDSRGYSAVCDVLVMNDGKSAAFWPLSNVMVLPSHPSGLDNFEESLPRGSSKYVNGEAYDTTSQENDVNDLDGDWVVVSFIGGNVNSPYISNYWPHTRNTYDTQTSGEGSPTSEGAGTALKQTIDGRGRYFRRINGVEHVINERGDIFLSTYYAGGDLTPNDKGSTTNGRFSREIQPGAGGGIRLNMKTTQPLELNWNEQEDGIGLNDAFDPTLPQTNPQQTTPYYSGNRTATYIRVQNQVVSFEVPGLFSVASQQHFKLASGADSDIIVGTRFGVNVGAEYDVTVGTNYTLLSQTGNISGTATEGDITFTSEAANFSVVAAQAVDIRSLESDIILESETGSMTLTAAQNIDITSTLATSVNATTSIDLTAGAAMNLTSTGAMTLSASALAFAAAAGGSIGMAAGIGATVDLGNTPTAFALKGTTYQGIETTLMVAIGAFAVAVGVAVPAVAGPATTLVNAVNKWTSDLVFSLSTDVRV